MCKAKTTGTVKSSCSLSKKLQVGMQQIIIHCTNQKTFFFFLFCCHIMFWGVRSRLGGCQSQWMVTSQTHSKQQQLFDKLISATAELLIVPQLLTIPRNITIPLRAIFYHRLSKGRETLSHYTCLILLCTKNDSETLKQN